MNLEDQDFRSLRDEFTRDALAETQAGAGDDRFFVGEATLLGGGHG